MTPVKRLQQGITGTSGGRDSGRSAEVPPGRRVQRQIRSRVV